MCSVWFTLGGCVLLIRVARLVKHSSPRSSVTSYLGQLLGLCRGTPQTWALYSPALAIYDVRLVPLHDDGDVVVLTTSVSTLALVLELRANTRFCTS